jgi:hypothetical protein
MLQRKLGTEVRVYGADKYKFIAPESPSIKKLKFIRKIHMSSIGQTTMIAKKIGLVPFSASEQRKCLAQAVHVNSGEKFNHALARSKSAMFFIMEWAQMRGIKYLLCWLIGLYFFLIYYYINAHVRTEEVNCSQ